MKFTYTIARNFESCYVGNFITAVVFQGCFKICRCTEKWWHAVRKEQKFVTCKWYWKKKLNFEITSSKKFLPSTRFPATLLTLRTKSISVCALIAAKQTKIVNALIEIIFRIRSYSSNLKLRLNRWEFMKLIAFNRRTLLPYFSYHNLPDDKTTVDKTRHTGVSFDAQTTKLTHH